MTFSRVRMLLVMATLSLFGEPQELVPFDGSAILHNRIFDENFTREAFSFSQTPVDSFRGRPLVARQLVRK